MRAEKIVVLNSGGLDSAVMLHKLRYENEAVEIHSLFFEYGQHALELERKYSHLNAEKIGAVIKDIVLPKFMWSNGKFFNNCEYDYDGQYVEWRNLIFVSYAFSYAESIGAKKIYLALTKELEVNPYKDTTKSFVSALNLLDKNIDVIAPLNWVNSRLDYVDLAIQYGIEPNTYVSCDKPVMDGGVLKPCGKCVKCKEIEEFEKSLSKKTPLDIYRKYQTVNCDEYRAEIMSVMPWELRVLWNNECQLNCKHCYYGFDELKADRLTLPEFLEVTKQALDLGISHIHVGGKEPLYDDSVADYIMAVNALKEDGYVVDEISLLTNGINVPKYIGKLKKAGLTNILISVGDILSDEIALSTDEYRATKKNVTREAVRYAVDFNIPVECIVTINHSNFDKLDKILELLDSWRVNSVNFDVVSLIGNASENGLTYLSSEEILEAMLSIAEYKPMQENFALNLNLGMTTVYRFLNDGIWYIANLFSDMIAKGTIPIFANGFTLSPEFFCRAYSNMITLTPDGYLLGCCSEQSCSQYHAISAGNVRERSLEELIEIGKHKVNARNRNQFFVCPYERNAQRY